MNGEISHTPEGAEEFVAPRTNEAPLVTPGKVEEGEPPTLEVVKDPKEEYTDVQTLFYVEHLEENLDHVLEQMKKIRGYIFEIDEIKEQNPDPNDLDDANDLYIGPLEDKLRDAFQSFEINGKSIDMEALFPESDVTSEDKFNSIAYEINYVTDKHVIDSI